MRRKRTDTLSTMETESVALDSTLRSMNRSSDTLSTLHDWYLQGEDEHSLTRYYKNDLMTLCKARGIGSDSGSKSDLIESLLHWRKHALPPGTHVSQLNGRHRDFPSMPNLAEMTLEDREQTEVEVGEDEQKKIKRVVNKKKKKAMVTQSIPELQEDDEEEEQENEEEESEIDDNENEDPGRFMSVDDSLPLKRKKGKELTVQTQAYPPTTDSAYASAEPGKDGEIRYTDLHVGRLVGSGGFKQVYRGKYLNQHVAIGVINVEKLGDEDLNDLENEMQVLKQLRHDSIVRFIGTAKVFADSTDDLQHPQEEQRKPNKRHAAQPEPTLIKYCIVTEFCRHGDLSDYMRKTLKPTFQKQLALMYDIAFGCSYLHGRRPAIIHRDLKSLNILIDDQERAKISDFGLAKIKKKARSLMHTVVGTPNWQAPEMWSDEPNYTEKVDIYSCGLIFWEILMWSNQYPFNDLTDFQIYEQVGKKNARPPLTGPLKKYPQLILDLITEMWAADPDARPSMLDVVSQLSALMR